MIHAIFAKIPFRPAIWAFLLLLGPLPLGPRVPPRLPRSKGDRSQPIQPLIPYPCAIGNALANQASTSRRCARSQVSGSSGVGRFPGRTPLDRRRSQRSIGPTNRVPRPARNHHRRPSPGRNARRSKLDDHRPPFAALGRDHRGPNPPASHGQLHCARHPSHPLRR